MALRNFISRGLAALAIDNRLCLSCSAVCLQAKRGQIWGSHGFTSSSHARGHLDDADDVDESGTEIIKHTRGLTVSSSEATVYLSSPCLFGHCMGRM